LTQGDAFELGTEGSLLSQTQKLFSSSCGSSRVQRHLQISGIPHLVLGQGN